MDFIIMSSRLCFLSEVITIIYHIVQKNVLLKFLEKIVLCSICFWWIILASEKLDIQIDLIIMLDFFLSVFRIRDNFTIFNTFVYLLKMLNYAGNQDTLCSSTLPPPLLLKTVYQLLKVCNFLLQFCIV